jgi:hypothetical protein
LANIKAELKGAKPETRNALDVRMIRLTTTLKSMARLGQQYEEKKEEGEELFRRLKSSDPLTA